MSLDITTVLDQVYTHLTTGRVITQLDLPDRAYTVINEESEGGGSRYGCMFYPHVDVCAINGKHVALARGRAEHYYLARAFSPGDIFAFPLRSDSIEPEVLIKHMRGDKYFVHSLVIGLSEGTLALRAKGFEKPAIGAEVIRNLSEAWNIPAMRIGDLSNGSHLMHFPQIPYASRSEGKQWRYTSEIITSLVSNLEKTLIEHA